MVLDEAAMRSIQVGLGGVGLAVFVSSRLIDTALSAFLAGVVVTNLVEPMSAQL